MQDAHDVVELAVVDGQARMRGLAQLVQQILPAVLHVDARDLLPRHHDVVHGELTQIQDRQEHLPVPRRDHRSRLGDHGAQLLGGEVVRAARGFDDAKHAQDAIRELIRDPK